jgi:hypothetical protein
VFRFGGSGTALLISLLVYIGLYPLMLGEIAARLAGGVILAVILVSGAITASQSRTHRFFGVVLAIVSVALQVDWLATRSITIEALYTAVLALFLLFTALVIFRHVLSFGPLGPVRISV